MTQKTVKIEVELPTFDEWEPTGEFRIPETLDAALLAGEVSVIKYGGWRPDYPVPIYRRKRWRAEEGGDYWVVLCDGRVGMSSEGLFRDDNARYEFGNYFRTEEQAKDAAESIKAALA